MDGVQRPQAGVAAQRPVQIEREVEAAETAAEAAQRLEPGPGLLQRHDAVDPGLALSSGR